MGFIDSHVHLSQFPDMGLVTRLAVSTGTALYSCGVDQESSLLTLEVSKALPNLIRPFVGVHPAEASVGGDLGWYPDLLGKAAGAGEIGLDPKYSETTPASAQRLVFEAQLEAAERFRKPVQVHSRGAERRCLEVLGGFRLPSVLLHWFEGEGLLDKVVDRGYFVSFGPALLYSKRLQRLVLRCPQELVLTESDGPVAFEPLSGASGPTLVPSVAFKIAQVWRKPFAEVSQSLRKNGEAFLGLARKG